MTEGEQQDMIFGKGEGGSKDFLYIPMDMEVYHT
jgi:hypothetical protein